MIKLIDLLNEAKQIGDIYHFTSIDALHDMILLNNDIVLDPDFISYAAGGYYSFTRDANLGFAHAKSQARLKLDGDKMSNRYKFEPYADISSDVYDPFYKSSKDFEAEERISSKYGKINLTPYIIDLQIVQPQTAIDYYSVNNPLRKEIETEYNKVISWFENKNIPIIYSDKKLAASPRVSNKYK